MRAGSKRSACPAQTATPITFQYDTASNVRLVTDQLGRTTERQYDELLRLTKVISPNVDDTEYTYFADGQVHILTDGEDNETTWAYDGAGRVKSETNELGDARGATRTMLSAEFPK